MYEMERDEKSCYVTFIVVLGQDRGTPIGCCCRSRWGGANNIRRKKIGEREEVSEKAHTQ